MIPDYYLNLAGMAALWLVAFAALAYIVASVALTFGTDDAPSEFTVPGGES